MDKAKINWDYPQPRQGLAGEWDKFVGPGATTSETLIALIPALLASVALGLYAYLQQLDWSFWQYFFGLLFAFDITGGITTNATSAAKRWYHRTGQGFSAHFGFLSLHLFHIILTGWLFRGGDIVYILVFSVELLVSGFIVLKVPLYLQRSIALLLVAIAIVVSLYAFSSTPGMEWFIPFLFIKLLASHLTYEQPYDSGS